MWINEKTLGVFILHTDIRYECWKSNIELPGILTDEVLAQNGYAVVTQNKPAYDVITQKLVAQAPEKKVDGWVQNFNIVALDAITISNNQNQKTVERVGFIQNQIAQGDLKAIRYLLENDTVKLDEWKIKAVELKTQLQELQATLPPPAAPTTPTMVV